MKNQTVCAVTQSRPAASALPLTGTRSISSASALPFTGTGSLPAASALPLTGDRFGSSSSGDTATYTEQLAPFRLESCLETNSKV